MMALLLDLMAYAAKPIRDRASACCLRIASVRTSNPGIDRLSPSSTKPRARSSSTTTRSSFRRVPPPNSLISARCSNRVNSSQTVVSSIVDPRWFSSKPELRAAKVNERLRVMMAVQANATDVPDIRGALVFHIQWVGGHCRCHFRRYAVEFVNTGLQSGRGRRC
jgi:hypothetical protein